MVHWASWIYSVLLIVILKVAPPSYRFVSILTTDLVLVAAAAMLVCAVTVGSWWTDEVLGALYTDAVERCPATDSTSVTLHSKTTAKEIFLVLPACLPQCSQRGWALRFFDNGFWRWNKVFILPVTHVMWKRRIKCKLPWSEDNLT